MTAADRFDHVRPDLAELTERTRSTFATGSPMADSYIPTQMAESPNSQTRERRVSHKTGRTAYKSPTAFNGNLSRSVDQRKTR